MRCRETCCQGTGARHWQTVSLTDLVFQALKEEETRLSLARGRSSVRSVCLYDERVIDHLILREWTRFDRAERLDYQRNENGNLVRFCLINNNRSKAFFEVKGPLEGEQAVEAAQRVATKLREFGLGPDAQLYASFIATGDEHTIKSLRSAHACAWSPLLLLNTGYFLVVGTLDARDGEGPSHAMC